MRCTAVNEMLTEYVYGDLKERDASAVNSHLKICANCREAARQIERVLELASQYGDEPLPRESYEGIRDRILARSRGRTLGFPAFRRPIPAYAAATVIAIFAVISGVGTRTEVARLERMNTLLSDSLRINNSPLPGSTHSETADTTTQDSVPPHPPGTLLETNVNY